jgi:hypothetical protein
MDKLPGARMPMRRDWPRSIALKPQRLSCWPAVSRPRNTTMRPTVFEKGVRRLLIPQGFRFVTRWSAGPFYTRR